MLEQHQGDQRGWSRGSEVERWPGLEGHRRAVSGGVSSSAAFVFLLSTHLHRDNWHCSVESAGTFRF